MPKATDIQAFGPEIRFDRVLNSRLQHTQLCLRFERQCCQGIGHLLGTEHQVSGLEWIGRRVALQQIYVRFRLIAGLIHWPLWVENGRWSAGRFRSIAAFLGTQLNS